MTALTTPIIKSTRTAVVRSAASDGTYPVICSTEQKDADDDVILQSGWDVTRYLATRSVCVAHDYTRWPVGRMEEIGVRDKALRGRIRFSSTPDGRIAEQLVQEGVLNSVSVGFLPLVDPEPRNGGGFIHRKQELLEVSIVPVPSNPGALFEKAFGSRGARSLGRHAAGSGTLPSVRELDSRFVSRALDQYIAALAARGHLKSEMRRMVPAFLNTLVQGLAEGVDRTRAISVATEVAEKEAL